MLWVTRVHIRVNRAATGWLIRRFIDPDAVFHFVDPEEVARVQRECSAIGFDAPGARYPHKDHAGRCSFEALVAQYRPFDRPLRALADIVHRADFPEEMTAARPSRLPPFDTISLSQSYHLALRSSDEAPGLRAISRGFPLVAADDQETLNRCAFLYDALYAALCERFRQ